MAFISLEANQQSMERARSVVASAIASFSDMSIPLRQVSIFLDRWNKQNFQTQGGKVGGWVPFKYGGRVEYKDGKRTINTSAKLLQDTGRLRMSFLPGVREGSAYIGSDLPYSVFHEKGTKRLPQRRMLPVAEEVKDDARQIFENWVQRNIEKANG